MCAEKTELGNVLDALTRTQDEALSFMKEAHQLRDAKIVATNKSIRLARDNAKLREYVQHKSGCHAVAKRPCTCGLDDALVVKDDHG